ncbi:NADP-dependent oxidoreductase [Gryllotalpicola protaetiae]|uniref:NADP-dependent oxidoreductase n=1 Tax=Gryllotalpicola protaetiae TaxID=2419771 RepID=A0A387BU05_9MICO|nr:NADP-dependent oxidoreductase [Gryllotalpicola protaetiae]AYG04499.1 NADP-dependent oxidoreductase [Gryllotalpicola protaetiae]
MARFARFHRFGPTAEVLGVVHEEPPHPGPGEVRVQVRANGLNPVDFKVMNSPGHAAHYGIADPRGDGRGTGVGFDFAGDVDELGPGVTRFTLGDAVLGGRRHHALGDFVIIQADGADAERDGVLIEKPAALDYDTAGALVVTARTAIAAVDRVGVGPGDTVLVSAAAGGVGVIAAQLARLRGATVFGTASEANHEFLRDLGVTPVAYGDGLIERLTDAAPDGFTAALDCHGPDSVDAALALGVPIERINTIAARGHRGAQGVGNPQATMEQFAEIVRLVADGSITVPIEAVYPIERVAEAYARLEAGHVRGKIVVVTR